MCPKWQSAEGPPRIGVLGVQDKPRKGYTKQKKNVNQVTCGTQFITKNISIQEKTDLFITQDKYIESKVTTG